MRRGRKAEFRRLAVEVRAEIGLDQFACLDPRDIADAYGYPVVRVSDAQLPSHLLDRVALSLSQRWSGALVGDGKLSVIVDNDFQPAARRNSTIAHEVAHILLEHPLQVAVTYERSCGAGKDWEDEASHLAAELLIPWDAAVRAAKKGQDDETVAGIYGVSVALARWRMNATGARMIAHRATRPRGSSAPPTRRP